MRVLFFGIFDPNYPRNRVLIKGLKANGLEVVQCQARGRGLLKYIRLWLCHLFKRGQYDVMLVAFPGQIVMSLVRKLTDKPLVFDAFTSLYDSEVYDRKTVKPDSKEAERLYALDKRACELADLVLVDTRQHLDFFVNTFKVSRDKFRVIPVGTDEKLFQPKPKVSEKFIVHFHGKYIPLQGVRYIVEAAEILRERPISFRFLGRGQEYQEIRKLVRGKGLTNIRFIDSIPYKKLSSYINDSDICLGIFGDTEKTQRVVPNKVVEYIACGKPVITAGTPAIRELLTDGENVLLCRAADSGDLAEKIVELYNDPELRVKLGKNARELYLVKLTPQILGLRLKQILNEVV